ncbi:MAG: nucleotidyltransferase family protein [Leptolyngbyaceae cyanobacterium]
MVSLNAATQTLLTELRDRLTAIYGARLYRFVLFGSHARGEARPDSDIDVLVVLTGEVNPGQEIVRVSNLLADLSLEHDTVINCLFMDANHFNTRQGPLLRNIRREGIAV